MTSTASFHPSCGSTHAGHVLHEDGQRPLHGVPQTAVVLDDALVAQVLQELDLALQRAHLLNTTNIRPFDHLRLSTLVSENLRGEKRTLTLLVSGLSGSNWTCLTASSRPVSAS